MSAASQATSQIICPKHDVTDDRSQRQPARDSSFVSGDAACIAKVTPSNVSRGHSIMSIADARSMIDGARLTPLNVSIGHSIMSIADARSMIDGLVR